MGGVYQVKRDACIMLRVVTWLGRNGLACAQADPRKTGTRSTSSIQHIQVPQLLHSCRPLSYEQSHWNHVGAFSALAQLRAPAGAERLCAVADVFPLLTSARLIELPARARCSGIADRHSHKLQHQPLPIHIALPMQSPHPANLSPAASQLGAGAISTLQVCCTSCHQQILHALEALMRVAPSQTRDLHRHPL